MRPLLYVVRDGRVRAEARDFDEALREARRALGWFTMGFTRSNAGFNWWLVAGWTEADAAAQGEQLDAGRHPRQLDVEHVHALIRAGLDPDLSPLREDDPCPFVGRPVSPSLGPFEEKYAAAAAPKYADWPTGPQRP